MSAIRRLIAATLAAMLILVGLMSTSTAASAVGVEDPLVTIYGHGTDACPAGALCLYQYDNYNGNANKKIWIITGSIKNLHDYGAANDATSYFNNSDYIWGLYKYRNFGLPVVKALHNERVPTMKSVWVIDKEDGTVCNDKINMRNDTVSVERNGANYHPNHDCS